MGNYILLCHGEAIEHSSFEVPLGSQIVYWGAPGYLLSSDVAWTSLAQIRMNPTDLESIGRLFHGLPPLDQRTLVGGRSYAPDLGLTATTNPVCIFINMNTNAYALLREGWRHRLRDLAARLNNDLLHLLCCTGDYPHPNMGALNGLQVRNPDQVIP
jgi:hypothetical protein